MPAYQMNQASETGSLLQYRIRTETPMAMAAMTYWIMSHDINANAVLEAATSIQPSRRPDGPGNR